MIKTESRSSFPRVDEKCRLNSLLHRLQSPDILTVSFGQAYFEQNKQRIHFAFGDKVFRATFILSHFSLIRKELRKGVF